MIISEYVSTNYAISDRILLANDDEVLINIGGKVYFQILSQLHPLKTLPSHKAFHSPFGRKYFLSESSDKNGATNIYEPKKN